MQARANHDWMETISQKEDDMEASDRHEIIDLLNRYREAIDDLHP